MHTAVPSAGDSDPEPLQIDIGIKEVAALTTEEKLQHFEDICTGDALKKYEQAVSDYTAYEEKILSEHKENARKHAALQIAAEKERIARETNKNLSLGQIEIRRSYSRKNNKRFCRCEKGIFPFLQCFEPPHNRITAVKRMDQISPCAFFISAERRKTMRKQTDLTYPAKQWGEYHRLAPYSQYQKRH